MVIVYVDYRIVPVEEDEHISEFTWVRENGDAYSTHHYFVNYPGAKDLERQVVEVVGGEPMVRYSCATVVRAFMTDLNPGETVAFKDKISKDRFRALLDAFKIPGTYPMCTYNEVIATDEEVQRLRWTIEEARAEAAQRFGNSL